LPVSIGVFSEGGGSLHTIGVFPSLVELIVSLLELVGLESRIGRRIDSSSVPLFIVTFNEG
jgi:hypothetical protein